MTSAQAAKQSIVKGVKAATEKCSLKLSVPNFIVKLVLLLRTPFADYFRIVLEDFDVQQWFDVIEAILNATQKRF